MHHFLVSVVFVLCTALAQAQSNYLTPYAFTTFVGTVGTSGFTDGQGGAALFTSVGGLTVDASGYLYIVEGRNIRKATPGGYVTTVTDPLSRVVAGYTDGPLAVARFQGLANIVTDADGNLYVTDYSARTVRKISTTGIVSTLAGLGGQAGDTDGLGSAARFWQPNGIAIDGSGNLYVTDSFVHTIRKITPAGLVSTVAGQGGTIGPGGVIGSEPGSADGTGSAARFWSPQGIAVDRDGTLYVADTVNSTIRKVTAGGVVTTLAGMARASGSADGTGSQARFYLPVGIVVGADGNLLVTDSGNNTLRKVTPAGVVSTLAGAPGQTGSADGIGSAVRFKSVGGIALDANGNVFVSDSLNYTVRRGQLATLVVPTITTQPAPLTVLAGANATFVAAATGVPPPGLQWQRQAAGTATFLDVANGGVYSGATTGTLTIANTTTAMSGDQFRCLASNGVTPDAISNAVALTVVQPSTSISPASRTVPAAGETYTIIITSNTLWTAVSNQAWANLSAASGLGNGPLDVTVAANTTGNARTATITIGGQTHTLTQSGSGAPSVIEQPADQLTVRGGSATFTITASGAGTLTYQWYFTPSGGTPSAVPGATSYTLTLTNVQAADVGLYNCIVSNGIEPFATSNAAHLTLVDRVVKLASQVASPGSTVVVPVQLLAHGDENALGFSVSFDPTKLSFVEAVAGAQTGDAVFNVNASQVASGALGLALAKPSGAVWGAGTNEVARITFTVGSGVTTTALTFGDAPVAREISSTGAQALTASYVAGVITAFAGYEADMNGNGIVTITDWVKVGRIVAGLDPIPSGVDFRKADCAPRSSLGNGTLSITDWVQAGRYAAGLDPLTPVGGPAAP